MEITAAGAKWYVSTTAPATNDQAGFEGILDWVEVKKLQNLGTIGSTFSEVTYNVLGDKSEKNRKGTRSNGGLEPTMYSDDSDAGQALVLSGVDGSEENTQFSHKIVRDDGATRYNVGYIYSAPESIGTNDDMITNAVMVKFDEKLVKVAAP